MTPRHLALSSILLLGFACDSPPAPKAPAAPAAHAAPASPTAPTAPDAPSATAASGELQFAAQPGWVEEKPTSSMRKAQYLLPRAEGDTEDASLVVFYFGASGGGGREANLTRWAGQFEQVDGSDSTAKMKTADRTVNGLAVTDVELSGTYVAETTPGSGVRVRKEGWRMIASIIEAPAGAYYPKLVGPDKTVTRWEPFYRSFVDALKSLP